MAHRREIERRLRAFVDINGILRVMKNLALMEAGKLGRVLPAQRGVVASLEAAAAELSARYPRPSRETATCEVSVLIGSERGFCGDFNEAVARAAREPAEPGEPIRIAVGAKLAPFVETHHQLPGPHVAEEVHRVVLAIINLLRELLVRSEMGGLLRLTVLHHDPDAGKVVARCLVPIPEIAPPLPQNRIPPILHLPPEEMHEHLEEEHLPAALHEALCLSLMAESRFRLQHIDGASRRMERLMAELERKRNLSRQEEIVEEIETLTLTLSADVMGESEKA